MKVAEYIATELAGNGVTDAFGIPGGVILSFLYALKGSGITPHLTYHEQTAGFAACGYAWASGRIGVAYATRGPGICNMITAIAEAYQESIPVVFITAHGRREGQGHLRFPASQEINIAESLRNVTKYAVNIDEPEQVIPLVRKACGIAADGKKGPVLIDVASKIWNREIDSKRGQGNENSFVNVDEILDEIGTSISLSKRPVLLIGEGLRHTADKTTLINIADGLKLPILSSRGALDILSGSPYYFGYVGSHGVRYSNFILSKADLIIAVGNSMAFPRDSASFAPVIDQTQVIRVEIDAAELGKPASNETVYLADAGKLAEALKNRKTHLEEKHEWLRICKRLKTELYHEDCTEPVRKIADFILEQGGGNIYVCDVGNNEFWFSRAYEECRCEDGVIISKSFGTLGSAIGKAIGAYYATGRNVICVVGDQGFQFNIQELQYIASHHLPIKILLINNHSSGMIADYEQNRFGGEMLHTTHDTGYTTPDFKKIAKAYGADDRLFEIAVDSGIRLTPFLPEGRICQDMEPLLDRARYGMLNNL